MCICTVSQEAQTFKRYFFLLIDLPLAAGTVFVLSFVLAVSSYPVLMHRYAADHQSCAHL